MATIGEWPSLGASLGQPTPSLTTPAADEWEMLSPDTSAIVEDNNNEDDDSDNNNTTPAIEVVMGPPPLPSFRPITRHNSQSAPDLREMDDETAGSSSVVMVDDHGGEDESGVLVSNPWNSNNKVSFKDAILSPSKHVLDSSTEAPATLPRARNKIKSRYVVTAIKRCAKSTGDLRALAAMQAENELDDDDHGGGGGDMGATDAMEYYNRKSHGAHGRSNGMKQRPDEAKRKQMIVQKKNLQRAKQKQ